MVTIDSPPLSVVQHSLKDPQQCEVTILRKNKNKNGKRNPVTQITGKKARKLSKKKAKLEKLQEVLEKTSQKEGLQNLNLAVIAKQHRLALHHDKEISPLEASQLLE
jgi:hypothetical protein